MIEDPARNDNRAYDYRDSPESFRAEYPVVASMVTPGARVLDFGCGNGSLLAYLRDRLGCTGSGIELTPSGSAHARAKGFRIVEGRLDEPRPEFGPDEFDFALCNVTLQMVMYPERALAEMRRVAPRQVVTFPNFAHWRNRLDLLLAGRMPRELLYGYRWYSTGHIHQFSARDFEELCAASGLAIRRLELVDGPSGPLRSALSRRFPNFLGRICAALLERA
ncbi:MAG: methyltransferase domain-containing protein [Myxococcales bacterium]|nr:methyltransferase domain-containing protein [Myxococcales bacterium]